MTPHLLILGGTAEASALAKAVAALSIQAVFSYAGRVARPDAQPLPLRVGGFGGVGGLIDYLRMAGITHVVDATHPFAAGMSRNAIEACATLGVPLLALTRPPWVAGPGDCWSHVPDMAAAVQALSGPPQRVFLAIGRTEISGFAAQPQHFYLLRFVDTPERSPLLPDHRVVVARGPFDVTGDRALVEAERIDLVVSKNSGGTGARAKLDAARDLGVPVLMVDRPTIPPRTEVHRVEDVVTWLDHVGTERGV